MSKLKLGYFADGPWSHNAFNLIVADSSLDIAFVVARTDSTDTVLLEKCELYGIPFYKGILINSDDFYEIALSHECDLFVSMSFNQIFKPRIAKLPKHGTINCHAGKLPFYRGRNILNWALINDEKEFGITVHYIDQGIDTGDIILQRTYPITELDTYQTLLEEAYRACPVVLYDSIKIVHSGKVLPVKQSTIHPVGFYCGKRGAGDEIVNWNSSSRVLFNFIRAICFPGPRAQTTIQGHVIKINGARMIEDAPEYISTIGQIVGKTEGGYIVKTADTTIEIFDVEAGVKLKIGDKLGS